LVHAAPVAVAECVKLFDIAELLLGLPLDPCTKARFERAVLRRKLTGRKRIGPFSGFCLQRQNSWLASRCCDDDGAQADRDHAARLGSGL